MHEKAKELVGILSQECENMEDVQALLKTLFKETIEQMLEAEMEEHLGYEKNSVLGNGSGNSRNGYGKKTLKTELGETEIQVPRDRNGDFESQVIEKRQTRSDDLESRILTMYAKGMSNRDIEDHLRDVYGVDASASLISRITDKILPVMADLKKVYSEPTLDDAEYWLEEFRDKWGKKYPQIVKTWEQNWTELSTYFKYPQKVRTLIYTTNAVEGFHRILRKYTKTKTIYPTDEVVKKSVYSLQLPHRKTQSDKLRGLGQRPKDYDANFPCSRSSKKISNCPIIIPQSRMGILHFLEISCIGRKTINAGMKERL